MGFHVSCAKGASQNFGLKTGESLENRRPEWTEGMLCLCSRRISRVHIRTMRVSATRSLWVHVKQHFAEQPRLACRYRHQKTGMPGILANVSTLVYYSSFHFLFHYPIITPMYDSRFHFLFHHPIILPIYYSSFHFIFH